MVRFFSRFILLLLVSITFIIIYLSYFGIETDRFDSLIKEKANEVSRYVKLNFKNTKIHLNPKELNLAVKLQNPKILVKGNEIVLSKIDLFLPLKSFITSDFLLQRAEIDFFNNDIKDLVKISNIFLPKFFNKKLNKIFSSGNLQGEFVIPFNSDGSIADNYKLSAKLLEADININKDFKINNLSTDIKYAFKSGRDKEINFLINQGKILNLDLQKSLIDINLKDDKKIIKSKIKTKGTSKYSELKIISSLLGLNLANLKSVELTSDLETSVKLWLDSKFKITDRAFAVNGKINDLNLEHKEVKRIKKFLPSYNSKIILKDTEISFNQDSNLNLIGSIKFDKKFEDFSLSGSTREHFKLNGTIGLTDLSLKIPKLNYYKDENIKANLDFNINSSKLGYDIKRLIYSSGNQKLN